MTDAPKETLICDHCGKPSDEVKKFFVGQHVNQNLGVVRGKICSECIGFCMSLLAQGDREEFERLVEEARAFKFPPPEPVSSNQDTIP
jgi:hypothetical protein